MSKIFINYRREDSAGHARALGDALRRYFGPEAVFLDVDDLPPGAHFPATIQDALRKCEVFLTLIGRSWLTIRDGGGARRIDDANDFVRREIVAALAGDVPVIPINLQESNPPSPESLPEDLRPLAYLQALALRDNRWEADVNLLIKQIGTIVCSTSPHAVPESFYRTPEAIWKVEWPFSILVFVATVLLALGGYLVASAAKLPFEYSTLPTLAAIAGAAGAVHGRTRYQSLWPDFILAVLIAVGVVLAILTANYVPGEVAFLPQTDASWRIAEQFAACLFCGFLVGGVSIRLIRARG